MSDTDPSDVIDIESPIEVPTEIPERQFTNLTAKQERFVQAYIVNGSSSLSAVNAGYPAKTAASVGWQLLKNPKILHALDSLRTKARANITKESFIDKAMEKFEKLEDTEPNSPRFLDIAGKALGYLGNNAPTTVNNHLTLNKIEVNALPPAAKWDALRNMLEAD